MTTYWSVLPEQSVFPKLHYLKEHFALFVRQWTVSPGILGEHGGESIHSLFNQLAARSAGIPAKLKRYEQMLKFHLLQANPAVKSLPEAQKKKKKEMNFLRFYNISFIIATSGTFIVTTNGMPLAS